MIASTFLGRRAHKRWGEVRKKRKEWLQIILKEHDYFLYLSQTDFCPFFPYSILSFMDVRRIGTSSLFDTAGGRTSIFVSARTSETLPSQTAIHLQERVSGSLFPGQLCKSERVVLYPICLLIPALLSVAKLVPPKPPRLSMRRGSRGLSKILAHKPSPCKTPIVTGLPTITGVFFSGGGRG